MPFLTVFGTRLEHVQDPEEYEDDQENSEHKKHVRPQQPVKAAQNGREDYIEELFQCDPLLRQFVDDFRD